MEVTISNVPYESPEMEIVEVKNEGIICASGGAGTQNYPWTNVPEE